MHEIGNVQYRMLSAVTESVLVKWKSIQRFGYFSLVMNESWEKSLWAQAQ